MSSKTELWQEYSKNGTPLENGGRPANHEPETMARPDYYGIVLVWLYRKTKDSIEILFQQRSRFVDRNALKWDASAGGHVDYGESRQQAAVREAKEEIGAEISEEDLRFIYATKRDMSIDYVYLVDWTGRDGDNFHFDDQEVADTKWVSLENLRSFREQYVKPGLSTDDIQFAVMEKYLKSVM